MIYNQIIEKQQKGQKQFALLIDPDKAGPEHLGSLAKSCVVHPVDFFFVGGSLLASGRLEQCIDILKQHTKVPVILFPGNTMQISARADAILFLSLISGRNPEMLIGQHVVAAPYIRSAGLEAIPTGYMLIDSGKPTAAQYMSYTAPIPAEKDDIAMCTAMAGEMLGMKMMYLDAGSGASHPVPASMIRVVKENIQVPLIAGGGLQTPGQVKQACDAGADIIVVGTAAEKNPAGVSRLLDVVRNY
jgi:phosphoglycerol geranylgeranyltransferase